MSTVKPRKPSWRKRLASEKELWFWTLLFIAWWAVFFLMPIYGISYAFFDYKPGQALTMDKFVGFKHFAAFFNGVGNIASHVVEYFLYKYKILMNRNFARFEKKLIQGKNA